ncbi:cytochrome P450 3A4 [Cucurbitaria berberidis CBS 394.84]|uniref:Cytochrome P450 3A4 n=1 Tax=Cucurbitaria berberidis CBS 394.84 TaxID=1168544 RepID=A0A9P4LDL6_9PLEO|nr:cytochrome P450 3A4 [Cucurbitaria berberidis CBS 394.84]KAF1852036.1 cytochrome P450 3A4 [Cucurbitaria berberidis CBS 394.84]
MKFTPVNMALLSLAESIFTFYIFPHVFAAGTLSSFFFIFSLFNLVIFLMYQIIVYPFFVSPLRHLPQAKGFLPIIGHARMLFQRPNGEPHLKMMKGAPNNGIILTRGFFHSDRLILTTPAALADVLVHKSYDFEKPPWVRAFLKRFLGEGLLVAEGVKHQQHRKRIMPAFHFRHIKELYPVFWSKSIEFCNAVKMSLDQDASKVLEIGHFSTQVTLDIIGLAGLGRDIGSLRNSSDELIKNYEEILEPTREKALFFILHLIIPPWLISILPWKLNERVRETTGNLKRICKEFVAEKKLKMKNEIPERQESRDILSIMIRSNDFSDENLVDQLLTFLAAGHETTSSALTWASYLLSTHPDVQARLRLEIHESLPDPKVLSNPGFDVAGLLERMPYLNGVCNEVLRLFPTIPVSSRISIRDTTVAGHFVPKGTTLLVVPWAINRNPALWGADSEDFVPERWIDKDKGQATMNGGADSNFAFLTFLHGPRSCIGERFARAELRALLAAFVGSFEMQMADPEEKIVVGGSLTSKPIGGMKLKLTPVVWAT